MGCQRILGAGPNPPTRTDLKKLPNASPVELTPVGPVLSEKYRPADWAAGALSPDYFVTLQLVVEDSSIVHNAAKAKPQTG